MGQTETWAYDDLGRLASTTDFNGQVIAYRYDGLGRVVEKDEYTSASAAASGTTNAAEIVTYAYDSYDGQNRRYDSVTLTSTQNPAANGTTTSYYDRFGNLVEIDAPQGVIQYAYDPATGAKTEVATANTDVLYAYDSLGRLTTVTTVKLDGNTLATPLVTTYTDNLNNALVQTTLPNLTVETRSYDSLNRLINLANTDPAGHVISSDLYTLNLDGTRAVVVDVVGTTSQRIEYTYDALGRLTREYAQVPNVSGHAVTYTYDLAGNRASSTTTVADLSGYGGTITSAIAYTYDANDRLTLVSGYDNGLPTSTSYTYDNDGNTLIVTAITEDQYGRPVDTKATTYGWDVENRLISAVLSDTSANTTRHIAYTYDDAGDRTSETVDGQTTTFLNDPNNAYDQVLEEYAPNGVLAATYMRGFDLLFQDRAGVPSYYAKDGLGSTRALTNASGSVTDTYTYDASGNLIGSTGVTTNEFLYAGYQFDAALGQDYLRARYLDTAAGRFTSRDSFNGNMGDPITQNHYLYANADSVNRVDYSGHDSVGESLISISIGQAITSFQISATFRGLVAAYKLANGASLGDVVLETVLGVAFDTALGAALPGLFRFAPRLFQLRAQGEILSRSANSVWNLTPFARGRAIEEFILERVPSTLRAGVKNFPVIDDFFNGVATSIKSLDLTAKTYQNSSALTAQLSKYASKLSNFTGRTYGGYSVAGSDITERVLVVAIERGAATLEQGATLSNFVQLAKATWPNVRVVFKETL